MPYVQRNSSSHHDHDLLDSFAPVVHSIGTDAFGDRLFTSLGRFLTIDHCAGFLISPQHKCASRIFSTSRTDADFAFHASHRYADEYWAHDPCLKTRSGERALVLHQNWNAIAHAPFREECYVVPEVVDRLSILLTMPQRRHVLVSVFRKRRTGFFSQEDVDTLRRFSNILAACTAKQASMTQQMPLPADGILSTREHMVAHLLVSGMTVGDVARSLALATNTIETYRKRLYAKLDVNSRVALAGRLREIYGSAAIGSCHKQKL